MREETGNLKKGRERRTSNAEHPTSNVERSTLNVEHRTSNVEVRNGEPQMAQMTADENGLSGNTRPWSARSLPAIAERPQVVATEGPRGPDRRGRRFAIRAS
jgi:hypothetical protein